MKWINCKKTMPAKYKEVLVWVIFASGVKEFTESWIEDDGWAMGSAKGFEVTHWMEITEPK